MLIFARSPDVARVLGVSSPLDRCLPVATAAMNLLQGKSNQYLREAILEESLEKVKRYLTLKIGKADVGALTEVRVCCCLFHRGP